MNWGYYALHHPHKSVCIVIATFNASRTLGRCLETIYGQDYPKIEVIIVDGGSTDETLAIARLLCRRWRHQPGFSIKIIVRRGLDSESAKAVGLLTTKADVYCDMAADNYLPDKHFVKKLMEPINSGKADASYSKRYYYDKKDSLLNRYFALFGVNDPVAFYLGKADRKGYGVEFKREGLATVGANGFFIKRKLLLKADIKHFYHIDVISDIIDKVRFAVVDITIGHDTGENIISFLKKRRGYFEKLYLENRANRRYHLYDPSRDFWKLFKFIIYSLTFTEPIILSIRGYLKIHDVAWFLHPIICFLTVFNYGFSYCSHKK